MTTYQIDGDEEELAKYGHRKIEMISDPFVIDYINTRHPVDYEAFFDELVADKQFTKKRFRVGAKTVVYPGSKNRRRVLALKAFGKTINDIDDKIVSTYVTGHTADKKIQHELLLM